MSSGCWASTSVVYLSLSRGNGDPEPKMRRKKHRSWMGPLTRASGFLRRICGWVMNKLGAGARRGRPDGTTSAVRPSEPRAAAEVGKFRATQPRSQGEGQRWLAERAIVVSIAWRRQALRVAGGACAAFFTFQIERHTRANAGRNALACHTYPSIQEKSRQNVENRKMAVGWGPLQGLEAKAQMLK